jgi:putative peptidoglycan lipid II flippase
MTQPQTTVQQIQRATLMLMAGTLLLNLVSFIKSPIIARYYGTSGAMDAYFLAFAPFNLLTGILLSGLHAVLIPIYLDVRQKQGETQAAAVVLTFLAWTLLAVAGVGGILYVGSDALSAVLGRGFDPAQIKLTAALLRLSLVLLVLTMLNDMCLYILNAHQEFFISALIPLVGALFSLGYIIVFHAQGIVSLMYGLIAGIMLQLLILLGVLYPRFPPHVKLLPRSHPDIHTAFQELLPLLIGGSFGHINVVVDQMMAAWLPTGSLAALNYANRLHTTLTQLLIVMLARAVLPYFALQAAAEDRNALQTTFFLTLRRTLYLVLPISLGIICFAQPLIRLVFERGAFTGESTAATASAWIAYTLGLPMQAVGILAARVYNVLHDNTTLMYVSAVGIGLNIGLNWVFMQWWGHVGIALSTSGLYIVTTCILLYLLRRKFAMQTSG